MYVIYLIEIAVYHMPPEQSVEIAKLNIFKFNEEGLEYLFLSVHTYINLIATYMKTWGVPCILW